MKKRRRFTIKPKELEYDSINWPRHYASMEIEPIDFMRSMMEPLEFYAFCCGNIIKYCSRWRYKGGVEDLKKAENYLHRMIAAVEEDRPKWMNEEKRRESGRTWDKTSAVKEPWLYPTISTNAADMHEKPMDMFDEV